MMMCTSILSNSKFIYFNSVSCTTSYYRNGALWAGVSIVLYPIGLPLFYLYMLWKKKDNIVSRNMESAATKRLEFLFKAYKVLAQY